MVDWCHRHYPSQVMNDFDIIYNFIFRHNRQILQLMTITEKPSDESGRGHRVIIVYFIRKPEKPNRTPSKAK